MFEFHREYYNKVASFYKHAHYVEKQCRLLVSFYRHYSKFWGDSWMLTLSKNALTKYKMLPYNLEGHRPILGICLVMMILYVRLFYILLMCSHHASMPPSNMKLLSSKHSLYYYKLKPKRQKWKWCTRMSAQSQIDQKYYMWIKMQRWLDNLKGLGLEHIER